MKYTFCLLLFFINATTENLTEFSKNKNTERMSGKITKPNLKYSG